MLRRQGETGIHVHMATFLDELRSRGYPVVFVNHLSAFKFLGLPIFGVRRIVDRINGSLSVAWYVFWHLWFLRVALRARLRGLGPAVVYAQCPISARAALDARRSRDQPVVMVVHFIHSLGDEWVAKGKIPDGGRVHRWISRLEGRTLPEVDGIVFLSRYMRDYLEARNPGLESVTSLVLPNFISPAPAVPEERLEADLITIGALDRNKNQGYILRVLVEAATLGRSYSLTIVGDGPERASQEAQVRASGLSGRVRFLGYRAHARSLLPAHRAYVHAARMDNFPMVVLEALAAGLPVLAPAVAGIPEMITDGVEGVMWPLDDPRDAAQRLIELLEDEPRRRRMGAAAERRFAADFQTSVVVDRLIQFLTTLEPMTAHTDR